MKFGQIHKCFRLEKRISLREYCKINGFDPGNLSKLERGLISPPKHRETVEWYAKVLKLNPGEEKILIMAAFYYHFEQLSREWEM